MAPEAMDLCLRVLKESNKLSSTATVVRNSVLIISHITFRDCQVHFFSGNLSRNSCILERIMMHCPHLFIARVVTLPDGPHKKKMMTVIQRDGVMAKGPVWLPRC